MKTPLIELMNKIVLPGLMLCWTAPTLADSVKCVEHYASYRNKVKYAENESYTEMIELERNKTQIIKTTVLGKLVSKEVTQDTVDGQTSNYSNLNNNLQRSSVTIGEQNISSSLYAQQIRNLGGGETSKEIRTANLEIDLASGAMTRTSTIETQRDKYFTITEGTCTRN
jgi:hypothetical protein